MEAEEPTDIEAAEREALGRVVHAIREYKSMAAIDLHRWTDDFSRLPERHQHLIPAFANKLRSIDEAVQHNHFFLQSMQAALFLPAPDQEPFLPDALEAANNYAQKVQGFVSGQDVTKVRYIFKNLMRDWSEEGVLERDASYGRMVEKIKKLIPIVDPSRPAPCVLVPGAGLGRLCVDLAKEGYDTFGNEFSFYMLLTSAFLLNHCQRRYQWTIHPWMHSGCNHHSTEDQLRGLLIPDIDPAESAAGGKLGMVAGDFLEVYQRPEYRQAFDCVATCFFIDTAHNVLAYLETIACILKPGGYWVNLGPLLYHWAEANEMAEEPNIELALEDVLQAAQRLGFVLEEHESVKAPFASDCRSMYQTVYDCAFWTMRRPSDGSSNLSQ